MNLKLIISQILVSKQQLVILGISLTSLHFSMSMETHCSYSINRNIFYSQFDEESYSLPRVCLITTFLSDSDSTRTV